MILAFVSAFFCVFNIVLWIFFLSKYKKFFSTDDIIESTREELNRMIADINRNAGRNIDIIEDRIKELKSVVAEADRHIAAAQGELVKQANLAAFQKKIQESAVKRKEGPVQTAAEKYKKNSRNYASEDVFDLTAEGSRFVQKKQAELFDDIENNNEIVSQTGTRFSITDANSPMTSVPVIGPNVSYVENPVEPKRNFNDLVHDLYAAGHSVEEIAVELNRSTTEVQLVVDMEF